MSHGITMKNFNPEMYTGVWHEIALIPQPYESQCTSALAIYSIGEGVLNIYNMCLDNGRIVSTINGIAIRQSRESSLSKLKVTFTNLEPCPKSSQDLLRNDFE